MSLGRRGYEVMLAEAGTQVGGRVARECRLPGLSAWGRVRDYRQGQLHKLANVGIYFDSEMSAGAVRETGCSLVAVATGATWRRDGTGRAHAFPVPGHESGTILTPDDIMDGARAEGPVVIFDDDHYYMGGVLAELLRQAGHAVTLVTPGAQVSSFTEYTLELGRIQKHMLELDVSLELQHAVSAIDKDRVDVACVHTGRSRTLECATLVMVTARDANDSLFRELLADEPALEAAGIARVRAIGDAWAPGTIADAVFAGHRFARELGAPLPDGPTYEDEMPALADLG